MRLSPWLLFASVVLLASCANPGSGCPRCASGEVCRAGRCVSNIDGGELEDGGADDAALSDAPTPIDSGFDGGGFDGGGVDGGGVDGGGVDGGGTDAGSCGLRAYFAPAGETAFRAPRDLDCGSLFAPLSTAPIQAVFDLERTDEFYFLTASTYHVLDRDSWTWVASGARDLLLPQASGVTLRGAIGQELYDGENELVMLLATPSAILYSVDGVARTATLVPLSGGRPNPIDLADGTIYPNWAPGSNAFAPTALERGRIVTAFHDSTGLLAPSRAGVTCTGAAGACADSLPSVGSHYTVLVTDTSLFMIDGYSCYCFFARPAIGTFGPFAAPGAPARSAWDHTAWNGGLWAFSTP